MDAHSPSPVITKYGLFHCSAVISAIPLLLSMTDCKEYLRKLGLAHGDSLHDPASLKGRVVVVRWVVARPPVAGGQVVIPA